MQEEVKTYAIAVYGGPNGHNNNRAQIQLSGDNKVVAWVRFHDPGMAFPADDLYHGTYNDIIRMHLPTSMFQSVLDILRNEKPVYANFATVGTISFSQEKVGEGEIEEVLP